jgi:hypothetical protein
LHCFRNRRSDGLQPEQVVLSLRSENGESSMTRGVSPDGSFTFPNVAPGTYRLAIAQPAGVWAKQVLAGGKPISGAAFEVTEDAAPQLTVIPDRGLAHVTGRVLKEGLPAPAVWVAMVPKLPSDDASDYRLDRSNSDGSFEMKSVHLGDYYLFAVETDELEYANRAAMQPLLKNAKPLRVEAGGEYQEEVVAQ